MTLEWDLAEKEMMPSFPHLPSFSETTWKPPKLSFPGQFQATIQASHGNHPRCQFQANFKSQSRQALETMWKPPKFSFSGQCQATIQASHGNPHGNNQSVETIWLPCGNHQSCHFLANFKPQFRQAMETHMKKHQSCQFQVNFKPQSKQALENTKVAFPG